MKTSGHQLHVSDHPLLLSSQLSKSRSALDARGKTTEGPFEDHVTTDGRKGNGADGKDLVQHSSHGEGPAYVEGACTLLPYMPPGVKSMSE